MTNEPKLVAQRRTKRGTREARRLRRQGIIPGNMYGHGIEPVALAVAESDLSAIVHGGHRVVDLDLQGNVEKGMFREVQWDVWQSRVLHFDLLRVSADERVEVSIPIRLKGVAPGTLADGHLEQPLHELSIECPALGIPEAVTININELGVGDAVHVADLDPAAIGEQIKVLDAPDTLIVQVAETVEHEVLPEEAVSGAVEPEVIGARKEETEEQPED